jgi:preprotein translocase subunit YajC
MDIFLDVVGSLIPPIFIGLLFWFIMRSILRADSKEREVYSQIEAEERAKLEKKPAKKG